MAEYKTLYSNVPSILDKEVNTHINNGWFMYGMQTSSTNDRGDMLFAQPVIKLADDELPTWF